MHTLRLFFISFAVFFIILSPAHAQESEDQPLSASVRYTADLYYNLTGGRDNGYALMDNIDVELEADLSDTFPALSGTSLYVYGLGNQGESISELAGDLQGVSNIEAENSWRLYEVWVQKKWLKANSSVLAGLYDVNSEFNALNSSALFLNSSHGIEPSLALSGTLGPSIFPYTSLGARFKVNPSKGWILKAAVLDGVPSDPGNTRGTKVRLRDEDGLFLIAEIGYHAISEGKYRTRNARLRSLLDPGVATDNSLSVGGWMYTRERVHWDPAEGNTYEYGVYLSGEVELQEGSEERPAVQLFSRLGLANEGSSTVHAFLGGGLVFRGLLPGREGDRTGLSVAHARAGEAYRDQNLIGGLRPEKAETNIELTHLLNFSEQLQLQGDLQYILNPGLNPNLDAALVPGLRFMLSL